MKRLSKAQVQANQKAALLQRVTDVYSGAAGFLWEVDTHWATAEVLEKVMGALRDMFQNEGNSFLFGILNIAQYDTPESATDLLFRNGVRT